MTKKYKVGYTTGVYDLFHVGHLNILENAKKQCDYLIVGVSTDDLVKKYKDRTPIISYEQRAKIVSSIKCVDRVVPQTSMDKKAAWDKLHFDVMFHGDDWKNSDMYNEQIKNLKAVGADVVFLKHTDGISTTEIKNKIREL